MAKATLRNIHKLIRTAQDELSVEECFLKDLQTCIEKMDEKEARKPSQSYKPSSMNCIRNMYFQVVGADRDVSSTSYAFVGICESGSDRHERLQNAVLHMKDFDIDCEYINVADYVKEQKLDYLEIRGQSGFETKLYHKDLNISFLCDGIIKYKGQYYVLEFKTETMRKWINREGVDVGHHNQAFTYSMCLALNNVIFIYENRDTLDKKCYLFTVDDDMRMSIISKIDECDGYVKNMLPPPVPSDVAKKTCSYCNYKTSCRKAGK